MASNTDSNVITLKAQDGKELTVSKAAAMQAQLIHDKIEGGGANDAITLPDVSAEILAKVMEYCEKHTDSSKMTEEDLKEWDQRFLDVNRANMFHLMMAANYLDISELVGVTSEMANSMIQGKHIEEFRQVFNI